MSDVIPTDDDERTARKIFMQGNEHNRKWDIELVAYETARHRRVIGNISDKIDNMDRAINGDSATGTMSLRAMMEEVYKKDTGREPSTETALERNSHKWDEVWKYIWIGVGVVGTLSVLAPYLIEKMVK